MKTSVHLPTILVVEDEDYLRQLSAIVLKRAGFEVLQARDATEAADIWRNQHASIDLLFTDVLMPGLSGPEIAQEFLQLRPDLKVIFTSGNSREIALETAYFVKESRFLVKPFTAEILVRAVKDAMK